MALAFVVELDLDGVWTDITSFVREKPGVAITRGRADEQATPSAAVCTFQVNNTDGRFSPRNPTGAWYGLFGRNTQVRVTLTIGSGDSIRFHGEVAAWPIGWGQSQRDVWVAITAAGLRRRLSQGQAPLRAAYERAVLGAAGVVAYWTLDDPEGSTQFAAATAGTPDMLAASGFDFAADDTNFPTLPAPLAIVEGGSCTADIGPISTGTVQARMFLRIPSGQGTITTTLIGVRFSGGNVGLLELGALMSTGQVAASLFDPAGAFIAGAGTAVSAGYLDTSVLVNVSADQNGTAVDLRVDICDLDGTILESLTDTSGAGVTLGNAVAVGISAPLPGMLRFPLVGTTVGHLAVQDQLTATTELGDAVTAYDGEQASYRIDRLCQEEGVGVTIIDPVDDTARLGPQPVATFLAIIDEAATVDGGLLTEDRENLAFTYTARSALYNQAPAATLDYEGKQVTSLVPTEDDGGDGIVNDLTVSRPDGSSARYEKTTGPLSTAPPPAGIGRYDSEISLNVYADDQLADQAAWRVAIGTVDEARYPEIGFNPNRDTFTTGQKDDLAALVEGQVIAITNPPTFAGTPDEIRQVVAGWTERLEHATWTWEMVGIPASPYDVGRFDEGWRYSPGSCETAEALDTTETAIDVTTGDALWTTDPAEYPFDINIGGERITAGGCTGTSNPQTFTSCTRSVNGVVKSHDSGAPVTLWAPAHYAL